ncbi:AbrB/MazE/SpoVT family DNA-binding domain-containing protein [Candidatus Woesearchaeota archaeon]|nr:AbrB/MazE/SpoVT family DNA-binding domain-containing protein [Candidatus Woesearchaeota archaeon]
MKRKVIQIAGSTQLVSLPRQWAKAHNISRGQEIDVQEDGNKVVISANTAPAFEKAEIDVSELNGMIARFIHALYKRGVDELKVYFGKPELMVKVQEAISKEAVGFEVLEQGPDNCTIRYVSGSLEEFDSVLRRTFLLLLTMSEQTYDTLKAANYQQMKNTAFLEEANNRFTTVCRRHLNKLGTSTYGKIGPLYYIIEELEKVADQYKYICQHFSNLQDRKIKINDDVLGTFAVSNKMLRVFYELFYKFDTEKIVQLKALRDKVVENAHKLFEKRLSHADYWLLHHSLVLANMMFCLVGPYITAVGLANSSNEKLSDS